MIVMTGKEKEEQREDSSFSVSLLYDQINC